MAFHWIAGCLSSLMQRSWTKSALLVAMAGATALAGVSAMRQDSPYKTLGNIKSVLALLKEQVREEDIVYAGGSAVPAMRFYQGNEERPANYHYRRSGWWCWRSPTSCLGKMADLASWLGSGNGRVWFITHRRTSLPAPLVEQVVADGYFSVYLIEDTETLIDGYATDASKNREEILTRDPSIRSTFDVHLSENMLIYVKEPCDAKDVDESTTFFLHLFPVDVNDLPTQRQQYGFDNLGFRFNDRGMRSAEQCVALRALPNYPIAQLRTGQFSNEGTGWEENFYHPTYVADRIAEIIHTSNVELVIRDHFDVYADKNKLVFVRNQCDATDTDPEFFLHIYPVDGDDLPAHRRQYGFGGINFPFNAHGMRSAEQCVTWQEFPDHAISSIRTGQFLVNEDGSTTSLWEGEVRFDE